MAIFSELDADSYPLDFEIIRNHQSIAFYRQPDKLAHDMEWFKSNNYVVHHVGCNNRQEFASGISTALDFKTLFGYSWGGHSLDALFEGLTDTAISDQGGTVICFHHFNQLFHQDNQWATDILEMFAEAARWHLMYGKRLIALTEIGPEPISVMFPARKIINFESTLH